MPRLRGHYMDMFGMTGMTRGTAPPHPDRHFHAAPQGDRMYSTSYGFGHARAAQTTIPCRACGTALRVERTCHEVFLRCATCRTTHTVGEYVDQMDDALESFMENVYCDRT